MTTETTIQPESSERLIEEGLFRLDETGTPRLRGSKCSACGTVFLGRRFVCLACFDLNLEETDLSAEGEVYSFTTVRQQSPDSLIAPPYTVVQVKLPERIIVTAPLLEDRARGGRRWLARADQGVPLHRAIGPGCRFVRLRSGEGPGHRKGRS